MSDQTGVFDMSDEHYRAHPALSHSGLKQFAGHKAPKGRFLLVGTAFHHALLQPKLAKDLYCTTPEEWNLATKHGKRALEAYEEEKGRIALRPSEKSLIVSMCRSVMEHPKASKIIKSDGPVEQAVIAELHPGILSKGLFDKILPKCLIDLKTTGYRTEEEFTEAIVKYGYDSQGSYYSDLYREVTGEYKPFVWVVVSKQSSDCWVSQLQPFHLATGRRWCSDMLSLYAKYAL